MAKDGGVMASVGVIGSGTWGTSLAILLNGNGHKVQLWSAVPAEVESLSVNRKHPNLGDTPIMNKRLDIMKNSHADIFVSIHMNSFGDQKVSGLHIFYDKNHPEIERLAKSIQNKMSEVTGAEMHAVKTADERLFLMKNPPMPAILVECGFLSNPDEEKKLASDEYQSKIAWAIASAIENYTK